ncbi:hypothetical protein VTN49DRAFT_5314 [Thermomyces lanuginosus]|uniref:uncharacterized protein n=1 Tax=Thermomyces lanuginosus TaxID=5541 RepID=UPI0037444E4D
MGPFTAFLSDSFREAYDILGSLPLDLLLWSSVFSIWPTLSAASECLKTMAARFLFRCYYHSLLLVTTRSTRY